MEEHRTLAQRIQNYLEKDKRARVASMSQAFPSDVAFVQALQLDCLELSDDMEGGVKWRSDTERALVHSIAGWHEGFAPQPAFVPLTDIPFGADQSFVPAPVSESEVLLVLENVNMSFGVKLQRVAAMLECTIGEALADRLLHRSDDVAEERLDRFTCRLCHFSCDDQKSFVEHLAEKHRGACDESRVLIEYRKKTIGPLEHAGPDAALLQFM